MKDLTLLVRPMTPFDRMADRQFREERLGYLTDMTIQDLLLSTLPSLLVPVIWFFVTRDKRVIILTPGGWFFGFVLELVATGTLFSKGWNPYVVAFIAAIIGMSIIISLRNQEFYGHRLE